MLDDFSMDGAAEGKCAFADHLNSKSVGCIYQGTKPDSFFRDVADVLPGATWVRGICPIAPVAMSADGVHAAKKPNRA